MAVPTIADTIAQITKKQSAPIGVPQTNLAPPVGAPSPIQNILNGLANYQPTGPQLDPTVQKLSNRNDMLTNQLGALGGKTTGKRPSLIHRVFDILSRPEYALSNFALQGDIAKTGRHSVLNQISSGLSGAAQGFEGKAKTMPTDVIQQIRDAEHASGTNGLGGALNQKTTTYTPGEAGPMQSILGKVAGIGANIAGDPLNLVTGIGLPAQLTKAAKLAGKVGEVSEATRNASRLAETAGIAQPGELETLVRPATKIPTVTQASDTQTRVQEILDSLRQHMLTTNTEEARNALTQEGRIPQEIAPLQKTPTYIPPKAYRTRQNFTGNIRGGVKKGFNPEEVLGNETKAKQNARLAEEISARGDEATSKAYKDIQSGVLEDMTRATKPETIRRGAVKIAGKQITLTPERISSSLKRLSNETGISSAKNAFDKAFVSTGNMSPEMQALSGKTRGASHGPWQGLITTMSQRFHGMKPSDIRTSLNHVVNNAPELGANPGIETAIHEHVGDIVDKFRNDNEHGLDIKDYNKMLAAKDKLDISPESANIINNGTREQAIKEFESLMPKGVSKLGAKDDPLDYLARLGDAGNKALGAKSIRSELTKFGIKNEGPVADELTKNYGYKELKQTPGYVYHPDIHTDASRMFDLLTNYGQSEEFTHALGKIVTTWKKLATIYNLPSYPTRNFIANAYMAWLVGGQHGLEGLKSSYIAAKVMRHTLDKTTQASNNPVKDVLNRELDKDIGKNGPIAYHTKGGFPVSYDMHNALYRGNGLESTFTGTTYASHPATATGVKAAAHKVNSGVIAANKAVEDFGRHGVFAHNLRLSNATNQKELEREAANAANKVRAALFDYSDSTAFEKKTMVKLFPFYKWNRKAIPALFHGMLDHPGKVLNFQIALQQGLQVAGGHPNTTGDPWALNQSEPLNRIPSYILDRMGSPFGKEGKAGAQQYLDPAVPFNDELRLLGDPSSIISQITPALRVPIEDTMQKQFYHDLPIKNRAEYSTVGQINILRSLLKASGNSGAPVGASGSTNGSVATSKSPLDALLQTFNPLNGVIGAQQNTPKSQAATLLGHNTALSKKIKALHDKAVANANK